MTLDTMLSLAGILLAITGIGITLFLYYFDVRTKLDSILHQLKSILLAHRDESNQKESEFSKSQFLILEKQDSALGKFHDDILARLMEIEHHQEGILTRSQALQLTNLYLDSVSTHLDLELIKFIRGSFPAKYKARQITPIMNEIVNAYDATVRKSIRPMVSQFVLRNGQTFYDLVTSINNEAIKQAFIDIEERLRVGLQAQQDIKVFVAAVKVVLTNVSDIARQRLIAGVENIYSVTLKTSSHP